MKAPALSILHGAALAAVLLGLLAPVAHAQTVLKSGSMIQMGGRSVALPNQTAAPAPRSPQGDGQPAPISAIPSVADIRAQGGRQGPAQNQPAPGARTAQAAAAQGPMIRLGELLETADGLPPEALALEIAPAPKPGQTVTLQKSRLQEIFRERLGESAGRIEIPGPVAVVSGGRIATEAEIRQTADDFLTRQLDSIAAAFPAGMRPEFEVRELKLPPFLALNEPGDQLVVEAVSPLQPGRTTLRVAARSGHGKTYRQGAGSVLLDAWIMAPTATATLPQGAAVTAENVTQSRVNLAQTKGRLWDGQGGPYRAKRAVNAGQPITIDLLESPPLAAKGDKVVLLYESGGLRLEAPAELMSDGRQGETVQARNMLSKKQVQGRLRDPQTVVVK